MVYKYNESISPEALADLRESVGWKISSVNGGISGRTCFAWQRIFH